MSNVMKLLACLALVACAGCRKEPAPAPPPANPPAPAVDPAKEPGADAGQDAKIEAAFASLSADDRALAMKQKTCPVGGGPLGAMGTPIKVEVAGLEVFICCDHCKEPLLEDPAKHLATIGLKPAAATAPQ